MADAMCHGVLVSQYPYTPPTSSRGVWHHYFSVACHEVPPHPPRGKFSRLHLTTIQNEVLNLSFSAQTLSAKVAQPISTMGLPAVF